MVLSFELKGFIRVARQLRCAVVVLIVLLQVGCSHDIVDSEFEWFYKSEMFDRTWTQVGYCENWYRMFAVSEDGIRTLTTSELNHGYNGWNVFCEVLVMCDGMAVDGQRDRILFNGKDTSKEKNEAGVFVNMDRKYVILYCRKSRGM